ncbi:MAG: hypothetical protein KF895_03055 [Parvibaculum sp.]|nr:hypothetical protein [Parvibaculum sp.]
MPSVSEIITWHEWARLPDIADWDDTIFAWNPCDGVHEVWLPKLQAPLEVLAYDDTYTHFALVRGPCPHAVGRSARPEGKVE